MKRRILITSVLAMAMIGLAATLWAATNETIDVTAEEKDNPQQNPSDIEGHFQNIPTADKDEIHVTNPNVEGKGAGVYNDPVNDGALLTISQESGPVIVDVDGREGIGAIYWVTVGPSGEEGGHEDVLWADVQDIAISRGLVLKDKVTNKQVTNRSIPSGVPMLHCPIASDGKGKVAFWVITEPSENRTYVWKISEGSTVKWEGVLNQSNGYLDEKNDLPVGLYSLNIFLNGKNIHRINFAVFRIVMGRVMKGSSEQTSPLVIGEDYAFEYTLEPAGITVPSLIFRLAHSISGDNYVAVHMADLASVASGLHTEVWEKTKWTVDHIGAYANPKNGNYGAFCTYKINNHEYRVSGTKSFTTQLVIEAKLDDSAPAYGISSGLYDPSFPPMLIQIGLKPQTGDTIFGYSGNRSFYDKTLTDMDNDNTSGDEQGKEIQDIIAKQIMQNVNTGTYTVVIKGVQDVAGNKSFVDEEGVIANWTIRLQ
jgi:hypothetical protein